MDVALRASIRRTAVVMGLVAALALGWALHGVASSDHASAPHGVKKFSAGDLIRLAGTATAGIYLQYTGVTGPPGTPYSNDAKIDAVSWGVSRSTATTSGTRVGLTPSVSDINITHTMDKFSAPLLQQSLTGQGANAILYFTNLNNKGGLVNYLEIDLTHVLITSFQTSASGATVPSESMSMNFESATFIAHVAGSPIQTVTVNNP